MSDLTVEFDYPEPEPLTLATGMGLAAMTGNLRLAAMVAGTYRVPPRVILPGWGNLPGATRRRLNKTAAIYAHRARVRERN